MVESGDCCDDDGVFLRAKEFFFCFSKVFGREAEELGAPPVEVEAVFDCGDFSGGLWVEFFE